MQSIGRYLSFGASRQPDSDPEVDPEENADEDDEAVPPPRAVAEPVGDDETADGAQEADGAGGAAAATDGSIRAPLSVEGETDSEPEGDDSDNESFDSANEKADSVSSFGSPPVTEEFVVPKAKVTGDSEDFSVPAVEAFEEDEDEVSSAAAQGVEAAVTEAVEPAEAAVSAAETAVVGSSSSSSSSSARVDATESVAESGGSEGAEREEAVEAVSESVGAGGEEAVEAAVEVEALAAEVIAAVAGAAAETEAATTEEVVPSAGTADSTTTTTTVPTSATTSAAAESVSAEQVTESAAVATVTAEATEAAGGATVEAAEAAVEGASAAESLISQMEGDIQTQLLRQAIEDASRVDVEDVEEDEDNEEWADGEEDEDEEDEEDDDEEDEDGAEVSASLDRLVRDMEAVVQGAGGMGAGGAAGGINLPPRMSAPRGLSNGGLDLPARPQSGARSADSGSEGTGASASAAGAVDSVARQAAAVIGRQGVTGPVGDSAGGAAAAAAAAAGPEAPLNPRAEKVNSVRVKLLRLAARLGQSHSNVVVAQVLYRLELAEKFQESASRAGGGGSSGGVRILGGGMGSSTRLDRARSRAAELDSQEGADSDLDFSLTVMVVGKTGVGKTATIQSLLGTAPGPDAPAVELPATTRVRELTGRVHGVKVRVIDVPGLHPSVADMRRNVKLLRSAKRFLRGGQPDIVLYVDRLDVQARDFGDVELVRPINETFGPAMWMNTIVVLTHASSAPPEDGSGRPMSYEMYVAQRSHVVQQTIRQASTDMRLLNPVALVENHPSCRTNRTGDRVLPNGQVWRPQLLLLCFASKCLSEANSVLDLGGPGGAGGRGGRGMAGRARMPPLPYLLSSLLGPRQPLRLPEEQQLGEDDEDDQSESDSEAEGEEEVDYDSLPPFRRLTKAELQQLEPSQRREYYEELADRERLFQKKQWREELRRRKELRKRLEAGNEGEEEGGEKAAAGGADGEDQLDDDAGPSNVPVPMPDLDLPPSFDSDHPSYRYRYIETANQWLVRPMLEQHGWDHDTGYDGFQLEKSFAIKNKVPASISGQITKDKKDCTVSLEAATSYRHGSSLTWSPTTTAGLDVQSVGSSMAYTLRSETRFRTLANNRTTAGVSVTAYGGSGLTAGMKVEDRLSLGKCARLNGAAGFVRYGRHMARGANCEIQLRHKDHPLDRTMGVLGLTLMDWQGDLVLGANAQAQGSVGKTTLLLRANVNNRAAGTISLRATSNEQLQMALLGLVPLLRYFLAGGFLVGSKEGEEEAA